MKQILSVLLAIVLTCTQIGCAQQTAISEEKFAYAGTTVTAQVLSMEGTRVTLQPGTLTETGAEPGNAAGTGNAAPPEQPGNSGSSPEGSTANSMPEKPGSEQGEEVPAKPDSEQAGEPPAKPDGGEGEEPPAKPDGSSDRTPDGRSSSSDTPAEKYFTAGEETCTVDFSDASIVKDSEPITVSDVAVGDIVRVAFDDNGIVKTVIVLSLVNEGLGSAEGNGVGGSSQVVQGSSANTIDTDGAYTDMVYSSSGDDENALRIDGTTVALQHITVQKASGASSNTENGDFYGVNAALLATNGATVSIEDAEITSSAQNGNGVFSYGSGTTVNISDSTITTTADNSGGIQTTGGGTTNAENLTIQTAGNSSAAIRSDRGGGTVQVTGGSYTTTGFNSPAVYSTASITVSDAVLTAVNSEALVIEGKNSITLTDCTVNGTMSDTQGASSDENVHTVMIYQSMSGDAEVGTSAFSMTGGSLTGNSGDLFYVTNTHCRMLLSGADLIQLDPDGYLLRVSGNSGSRGWGSAGSNGAQVEFTADGQALTGDIAVDRISALTMTLKNGSVFTGTVNILENAQGGTAVDCNAAIVIESGCTWNLTGDCTVSTLTADGTINYNGYTITLADGTVLQ